MFIIISNRQGQLIADHAITHWKLGKAREDITVKELNELLNSRAYKDDKGPLAESLLIKHNLVSYFVPFLPLLREHVRKCAENAMKRSEAWERYDRPTRNQISKRVADLHDYIPAESNLFSSTGCKTVETRLQLVLGEYEDDD